MSSGNLTVVSDLTVCQFIFCDTPITLPTSATLISFPITWLRPSGNATNIDNLIMIFFQKYLSFGNPTKVYYPKCSSSSFVVQFYLAHLSRVQIWSTLPKVYSNVTWFTLESSSVLVFIFVVLSPVSRVLPRLVILLRSLHQFLSTVYLWVECYLLPLQVPVSFRYCLPSG